MGGGNVGLDSIGAAHGGLSPRGRGKPSLNINGGMMKRSIPAWAGETVCQRNQSNPDMVYPRVGEGNIFKLGYPDSLIGLSPRGRGKQRLFALRERPVRSIPAWAGETCARLRA